MIRLVWCMEGQVAPGSDVKTEPEDTEPVCMIDSPSSMQTMQTTDELFDLGTTYIIEKAAGTTADAALTLALTKALTITICNRSNLKHNPMRIWVQHPDLTLTLPLTLGIRDDSIVPEDRAQAVALLDQAALDSCADAQYALPIILDDEKEATCNREQPFEMLWSSAEHEQPAALLAMGKACLFGGAEHAIVPDWLQQNAEQGAKYIWKAADLGHIEAQCMLGTLLLTGQGVPQDTYWAERMLQLAAAQGCAEANYHLGEMVIRLCTALC